MGLKMAKVLINLLVKILIRGLIWMVYPMDRMEFTGGNLEHIFKGNL